MSIIIQVGTYEGHPITQTLSDEMLKDAEADGFTEQDLIDMAKLGFRDWQADC